MLALLKKKPPSFSWVTYSHQTEKVGHKTNNSKEVPWWSVYAGEECEGMTV